MNKEDWKWWQDFRDNLRNVVSNDEYLRICELHSVYFNHKLVKPCKCNPAIIQGYIDDLNQFWSTKPKPRAR